jgi:hypothetical protein
MFVIITLILIFVIYNLGLAVFVDGFIQSIGGLVSILLNTILVIAYIKLISTQENQKELLKNQENRLDRLEKPEIIINNFNTLNTGIEVSLSNLGQGRASDIQVRFNFVAIEKTG